MIKPQQFQKRWDAGALNRSGTFVISQYYITQYNSLCAT